MNDKTISQLYFHFLAEQRRIAKAEASGERKCGRCGNDKRSHLADGTGRCSVSTLSGEFSPVDAKDEYRVNESISLIEKLAELNGLSLC